MDLSAMDQIHIRDLLLQCIIGVNPDERIKRQDVLINIVLYADLSAAGRSDLIEDTVNYKTVHDTIVELVQGSSFFLVERLADRIAKTCLSTPGVKGIKVKVDKPGVLQHAQSVGVEIFREQG